jgi:hypothetical protein
MIRYVHKNPLDTHPPLVAHAVEFPWSSARAYAGLTRASPANPERARTLLGPDAHGVTPSLPFKLASLEPASSPTVSLETLVEAAGQAYSVLGAHLRSNRRAPVLAAARSVFVALGRLESYRDRHLAAFLGRTRARAWQLRNDDVDLEGVRVARTLLRVPGLRAQLKASGLYENANLQPPAGVRASEFALP